MSNTKLFLNEEILDIDGNQIEYPNLNDKISDFYQKIIKNFGNKENFTQVEIIKTVNDTINNSAVNSNLKVRNVLRFVLENGDLQPKESFLAHEIVFDMRSQASINLDIKRREFLIFQLDSILEKMRVTEKQPHPTVNSYWKIPVSFVKYLIDKGIDNTPVEPVASVEVLETKHAEEYPF